MSYHVLSRTCYNAWLQRHNAIMNNPNCDGSGPHSGEEVRVVPIDGDSNALLCFSCYRREMTFRQYRNGPAAQPQLSEDAKFKLPAWESLKVYGK